MTIATYAPSLFIGRTAMGQHLVMMSGTVLANCRDLGAARERIVSLACAGMVGERRAEMVASIRRMRARAV